MVSVVTAGAEFAVNTATTANQTAPAIGQFADGSFVIVWGSLDTAQDGAESAIKGQRFDSAGNKVGSEFLVNSQAFGSQFTPAIAVSDNGNFLVSWVSTDPAQDGSGNAIKAQLFDASGTPIGVEFLVNTQVSGSQSVPNVIALADGRFVVSWDDSTGFDMKAQLFGADGAPIGGEIRVNTNTNAFQEFGDIVALADGGFVATWRTTDTSADGSEYAVKSQIFDASGARVGAEFLVNTSATGFQYSPSLAALPDGGFVVAWYTTDPAQDGNSGAIKAQRFDAAGAKVGAEFLVNSQGFQNQSDPQVTALENGAFMVAWSTLDPAQDGSSMAVKAQIFDADGTRLGDEFLVNSLATGSQFLPDVSVLPDGRLVVAWTSESGDGSGYAVRARIFEVDLPNDTPIITSDDGSEAAAITIVENQVEVTIVSASDADGPSPISYAITGGADAAQFTIDPATGALRFSAAPNFEIAGDADGDNVYEVIVVASDGESSDIQTISVSVADANEPHSITSNGGGASAAIAVDENATAVTTVAAADPEGALITYSLAGGVDAALFTIDATTGELSFNTAPDFEAPVDADGDNRYEIVVAASDGHSSVTQTLSVTVANRNDAPEITSNGGMPAVLHAVENSLDVASVAALDADGDGITYSIAGGADAGHFTIDAESGLLQFVTAQDYEAPADADGDNVYDVVVAASDGLATDTQSISIVLDDADEPITILSNGGGDTASVTVNENSSAVAMINALDPEGTPVQYVIAQSADSHLFAIDPATGELRFVTSPDFEAPADANGDGIYEVAVGAVGTTSSDFQAIAVTVANVRDGNTIIGSSSNDTISGVRTVNGQPFATEVEDDIFGNAGSDTISGGGGDDWIDGGSGNDVLAGGDGSDRLTGGLGADRFTFESQGNSTPLSADMIVDFSRAQGDRISLKAIDANSIANGDQGFNFIGTNQFTGVAGQLRYEQGDGQTLVSGDVNGDGTADFQVILLGTPQLQASDFML